MEFNAAYATYLPKLETAAWVFSRKHPIDFEDTLQHLLIGLWRATLKYEESRGVQFNTYMWCTVRNELANLYKKFFYTKTVSVVESGEIVKKKTKARKTCMSLSIIREKGFDVPGKEQKHLREVFCECGFDEEDLEILRQVIEGDLLVEQAQRLISRRRMVRLSDAEINSRWETPQKRILKVLSHEGHRTKIQVEDTGEVKYISGLEDWDVVPVKKGVIMNETGEKKQSRRAVLISEIMRGGKIKDIAQRVVDHMGGDLKKVRNNAYVVANQLMKKGQIQRVGNGIYEAVTQSEPLSETPTAEAPDATAPAEATTEG